MVLSSGVLGCRGGLELIESKVLTAAGTFTFSGIPQTYADLLLVGLLRSSNVGASDNPLARFNGDAGNNYDWHQIAIDAVPAVAAASAFGVAFFRLGMCAGAGALASRFSPTRAWILGYRNATAFKACLSEEWNMLAAAAASVFRGFSGADWRSLAAITSILVYPAGAPGTFAIGSQLSLYGLGG